MSKAYAGITSGHVWHITQRCIDNQFLLTNELEKRRWLYWLYQAKRQYGLSILNYVVTSNHVHVLVHDDGRERYKSAMQMINARTQAEFNRQCGRRGDFWEPNYQAAAVQTGAHLQRCITYMDLNMVRAGVVEHPKQWCAGGYYEHMNKPTRGSKIDRDKLQQLLQLDTDEDVQCARTRWVDDRTDLLAEPREFYWSNSIAVGDLEFALKMKRALAFAFPGRRAQRERGCFAVR